MISPFADPEYKPELYYYTDAISDHAARYINEHVKKSPEKPFFLYVAYTAAHWPMHALPEDIAKYRGKYDQGYAPVRQARFEKAKKLGVIAPDQELTPGNVDWNSIDDKRWEAAGMEVYAAMVDRMDQGIGRIVDQLKSNGQFENTIIFYMQDNGGCAETQGRSGNNAHPDIPRPEKPTLPVMKSTDFAEGGSVPRQTRDGYPVRMGKNAMPGTADTYVAYGPGWANVSNTPFREFKHFVHEGGISTPLVAHWPAGIQAKGELRHQPGHLIDIAATCVDLAGAKYPTEVNGNAITPLQGTSLRPAFANEKLARDAIFWEHEGNRAMRSGDMKLVAKGAGGDWELYDIAKDRAEMHNLAATMPEKLAEMKLKWENWAKSAQVLPWIWEVPYGQKTPAKTAKKKAQAKKAAAKE
jgi:arylsulfatase